jgi:hypothetical protein
VFVPEGFSLRVDDLGSLVLHNDQIHRGLR